METVKELLYIFGAIGGVIYLAITIYTICRAIKREMRRKRKQPEKPTIGFMTKSERAEMEAKLSANKRG